MRTLAGCAIACLGAIFQCGCTSHYWSYEEIIGLDLQEPTFQPGPRESRTFAVLDVEAGEKLLAAVDSRILAVVRSYQASQHDMGGHFVLNDGSLTYVAGASRSPRKSGEPGVAIVVNWNARKIHLYDNAEGQTSVAVEAASRAIYEELSQHFSPDALTVTRARHENSVDPTLFGP